MSSQRPQETSSKRRQGASFGVTYRTLWRQPQYVLLERPQDVIFQRPKDVGRRRPQDVGRGLPWRYIEDHMGTSIGRLLWTSSERPQRVILPSGMDLLHKFQQILPRLSLLIIYI